MREQRALMAMHAQSVVLGHPWVKDHGGYQRTITALAHGDDEEPEVAPVAPAPHVTRSVPSPAAAQTSAPRPVDSRPNAGAQKEFKGKAAFLRMIAEAEQSGTD